MAPTEILAEQHALTLRSLLRGSPIHVELVSGSLSQRERDHAARLLRSRHGADRRRHACAGQRRRPCFHKLGLVIIDEQHRFGVMQRARTSCPRGTGPTCW